MKIYQQIVHEAETIINIANLANPNARDIAQLKSCIRRLQELSCAFEINWDTLVKIVATSEC